jgi:hypothetical protein
MFLKRAPGCVAMQDAESGSIEGIARLTIPAVNAWAEMRVPLTSGQYNVLMRVNGQAMSYFIDHITLTDDVAEADCVLTGNLHIFDVFLFLNILYSPFMMGRQ